MKTKTKAYGKFLNQMVSFLFFSFLFLAETKKRMGFPCKNGLAMVHNTKFSIQIDKIFKTE